MSMSRKRFLALALFGAVAALPLFPGRATAQEGKVYLMSEVQSQPKLSSVTLAARLILESYPADLKSRGVGGLVELQFVVDEKGKVEAASVEIVDATQTTLAEAAKKVVSRLDFTPGKMNGAGVRTKVVLPILYKP